MSVPIEILRVVDALNSYVRSDAARRAWVSNLKRVIYHYKRQALLQVVRAEASTQRLVVVTQTCIDCGGKRRYTDQNGYTHDHCWKCGSTGTVKLKFIESTLTAGFIWHTPDKEAWSIFGRQLWDVEHEAGDWLPNQKGRDLAPDDVATHLMAVEDFFHERPQPYHSRDEWDYTTYRPHETYTLWAGDADRTLCGLCGTRENMRQHGFIVRTGRLHWRAALCMGCEQLHNADAKYFELLGQRMPESLLTPAVRRWAELHPHIEKERV
jgi:hypothetical protein